MKGSFTRGGGLYSGHVTVPKRDWTSEFAGESYIRVPMAHAVVLQVAALACA